jgi:hypothetical protein
LRWGFYFFRMDFEQLSKEQLIDIIHDQADEIAALQMQIGWVNNKQELAKLPEKEALKKQPVEIDGQLWYFTCARWKQKGKTVTAYDIMADEQKIRAILATPYQMILKKVITNPFQ